MGGGGGISGRGGISDRGEINGRGGRVVDVVDFWL